MSWTAWTAIEFLCLTIAFMFLTGVRALFSWPDQNLATVVIVLSYIVGIAGGMTAADRVRRRLELLPIRDTEEPR